METKPIGSSSDDSDITASGQDNRTTWRMADLRTHHLLAIAVACAAAILSIAELFLLQAKYQIFTGGFLQPYAYQTFFQRTTFVLLGLSLDLALAGILTVTWFVIATRLRLSRKLTIFNFGFLAFSACLLWLVARYKLLSYASDALNFYVIRQLGGGSLSAALRYVADEMSLLVIILAGLAIPYVLGLHITKRTGARLCAAVTKPFRYLVLGFCLFVLVYVPLAIAVISADPELRYGFQKKTSFLLFSQLVNELTDIDRDGYGAFSFPPDPAPVNADISPNAPDVPGNGIDENGLAGDLTQLTPLPASLSALSVKPFKHILLVVLESARSELVGKTWNGQLVAPNTTALADKGSSAPFAYSHNGFTIGSLTALFNGTLTDTSRDSQLVGFLKDAGYHLSFISGQDESFGNVAEIVGMKSDDVFLFHGGSALEDRVFPSTDPGSVRLSEPRVTKEFIRHIKSLDWTQPQFIYVNLQAAHFPYSHPSMEKILVEDFVPRSAINAENQEWVEATYWNAIAVADKAVGIMLDELKTVISEQDLLIVVTSDHGESLFNDGTLGHGHGINADQTRIPFIVNEPGIDFTEALGQTEFADVIVALASERADMVKSLTVSKPVFQHVGNLRNPVFIGHVSFGDQRTLLDLRTRQVYLSEWNEWLDIQSALDKPDIRHRLLPLVNQWESLVWMERKSRNKDPN